MSVEMHQLKEMAREAHKEMEEVERRVLLIERYINFKTAGGLEEFLRAEIAGELAARPTHKTPMEDEDWLDGVRGTTHD